MRTDQDLATKEEPPQALMMDWSDGQEPIWQP